MSNVILPDVTPSTAFPHSELSRRLKKIDRWVRRFVIRKKRLCYYRAYVLGFFLRRWGLPVQFNVGLRNLDERNSAGVRGHCWLSLDGQPILEMDDPRELYPHVINETPGGVRYCLGAGNQFFQRYKVTVVPDSIYTFLPIALDDGEGK